MLAICSYLRLISFHLVFSAEVSCLIRPTKYRKYEYIIIIFNKFKDVMWSINVLNSLNMSNL